jgi:hypothetical protein
VRGGSGSLRENLEALPVHAIEVLVIALAVTTNPSDTTSLAMIVNDVHFASSGLATSVVCCGFYERGHVAVIATTCIAD